MGIGLQIATFIAVYAVWGFANIRGIGWGWAGVIWLYSLVFYIPLDIIKFATRYILSGRAWDNMLNSKVLLHFLKESERNCRLCMCLVLPSWNFTQDMFVWKQQQIMYNDEA
jgi:hypothetical protein